MTKRARHPVHLVRAEDTSEWLGIGWTYCGEHPSMPGFAILEWREGRRPVAPFPVASASSERQHIARAVAALDGEAA